MTADTDLVLPRDVLANPRVSRWIAVSSDGTVDVRVGKVELGQGILTALAQVAADGLGVPVHRIRMLPAHTDLGPDEGLTAGSMSVFDAAPALRVVTTFVRGRFVTAAARLWAVDPTSVTVADGVLTGPGGRRSSYGELATDVDLDVDLVADTHETSATIRAAVSSAVVGTSVPRIDLPAKVTGHPVYIGDLHLPGMLTGRVVRPPSPGAQLRSMPSTTTPDVVVVRDGSFLGVVGPDQVTADSVAEQLVAGSRWDSGEPLPYEEDLTGLLLAGPHEEIPVLEEERDERGGRRITARYSRPFLAHASIGTSTAVARWEADGRLTVWSHSQGIHRLRDALASALELAPETISVEHVQNAGCYGHNGADDAALDAVLLARAVPGRPVMVRWSRQDELAWSPFGSAMLAEVSATLTDEGRISGWAYDVYSQGHTARPGYASTPGLLAGQYLAVPVPAPPAADPPPRGGGGTTRNAVPIYDVGPRRVTGHRLLHNPVRSSALRALGAFLNVFSIECFMDELAEVAGVDPLELRLRHLGDERARAVLQRAADEAGWGAPRDEGVGLGIGLARYKERGAYCAVVAEVQAEESIVVRRLTVAVDVGRVLNPDGVRNQIEGGAVQATSWATRERVRFDRERVTSVDWERYPILRFSEVPPVDVHVLDRPDLPSVGAGEAAQGPTAAAVGNAVAAALGVRVRDLPITREAVLAAIEAQP